MSSKRTNVSIFDRTLTPDELRKDIAAVERMLHDWEVQGRLDAITEADLKGRLADLRDELHVAEHPEEYPSGQA